MASQHLFCPLCGYCLFGIPEQRCPECGAGYDRAGVVAWSRIDCSRSLTHARGVIARSIWAAACAVAALAGQVPALALAVLLVLPAAAYLARHLAPPRPPTLWDDGSNWLPVVASLVLALLFLMLPTGAMVVATLLTWRVCICYALGPTGYPYSTLNQTPRIRQRVHTYQVATCLSLGAAGVLTMLTWVL